MCHIINKNKVTLFIYWVTFHSPVTPNNVTITLQVKYFELFQREKAWKTYGKPNNLHIEEKNFWNTQLISGQATLALAPTQKYIFTKYSLSLHCQRCQNNYCIFQYEFHDSYGYVSTVHRCLWLSWARSASGQYICKRRRAAASRCATVHSS